VRWVPVYANFFIDPSASQPQWHPAIRLAPCGVGAASVCFGGSTADGGSIFGWADSAGAHESTGLPVLAVGAGLGDDASILLVNGSAVALNTLPSLGTSRYFVNPAPLLAATRLAMAPLDGGIAIFTEDANGTTGMIMVRSSTDDVLNPMLCQGELFQAMPTPARDTVLLARTCNQTSAVHALSALGSASVQYMNSDSLKPNSNVEVAATASSVFVAQQTASVSLLYRYAPGGPNHTARLQVDNQSGVRLAVADDAHVFVATNPMAGAKLHQLALTSASSLDAGAPVKTFDKVEILGMTIIDDPTLGPSLAFFGVCRDSSTQTPCTRRELGLFGFLPLQ
jgi:hypothetical protein